MAASAISGHGVCEAHTPAPAIMTAIFTMQSLRVQSQTDMVWLSPCRCRYSKPLMLRLAVSANRPIVLISSGFGTVAAIALVLPATRGRRAP